MEISGDKWDEAFMVMEKLIESGDVESARRMIPLIRDSDDLNHLLLYATRLEEMKMAIVLIRYGADNFHQCLYAAIRMGNHALIDFFIRKGARDWDWLYGKLCGRSSVKMVNCLSKDVEEITFDNPRYNLKRFIYC